MKKTYAEVSIGNIYSENHEINPKDDILSAIQYKIKKNEFEKYSAGILPFYIKNKTIYFLLGKDNEGKWSDFGGRSEISDKGRWDVTAAREFYEETIGSVIELSTMVTKLQLNRNYIRINDKTLGNSEYYMYVVKIPYKEIYRHNFISTLSFINYINKNNKYEYKKYLEKIDIQWVSIDTIKKSLESNDNEHEEYPLRYIFKRTLEKNINKILEFCNLYMDKGHECMYE